MPVEVILPKVDMDMATGRITRWHVEEGAAVKKGDVLFEIETDKAAMEIDAPASGIVRDISGSEGLDIPVGQAVAWIYEEGEGSSSEAPARGASVTQGEPSSVPSSAGGFSSPHPEEPRSGVSKDEGGAIPQGRAASPSKSLPAGEGEGIRATPLARRLAREAGIGLAAVAGSGPRGRIRRADVEEAMAESGAEAAPVLGDAASQLLRMRAAEGGGVAETAVGLFAEGSYELVPHDAMRWTIARRLAEAKATIPHFYLSVDCAVDSVLALRRKLNEVAPRSGEAPAYRLSVNDMIVKAFAMALAAVPEANVSWSEEGLLRHRHVDVGVAVSIPGGLITPIVRRAEAKTLSAISREMEDLAARARARRLRPEEYRGGTTAVSNLGMFGIREFSAIINPPHATILAVGASEERAVVRDGEIVRATMMAATLAVDHRAVDGALGAELLATFKRLVENPMAMLV